MMVEDLDQFFDVDEHAVAATIGAATVNGNFEKAYAEAFGIAAGSKPTFLCNAANLPAITLGTTTAVINSTTYTIVENQPDGFGLTTLVLQA